MLQADQDLVGCPVDFEGRPAFIKANDAVETTRTEQWVIYSVPLQGTPPVDVPLPLTGPVTGGPALSILPAL